MTRSKGQESDIVTLLAAALVGCMLVATLLGLAFYPQLRACTSPAVELTLDNAIGGLPNGTE